MEKLQLSMFSVMGINCDHFLLGGCVFCNLNEDDEFKYGKLLCKSGIMAHNFCMV